MKDISKYCYYVDWRCKINGRLTVSLVALDRRGDLMRSYRSNRWKKERGQDYRCAITFNENPSRRKIWPGSKNFPNFNPSFETGDAEKKKAATFVL